MDKKREIEKKKQKRHTPSKEMTNLWTIQERNLKKKEKINGE